ncbi:hypothetical protein AJ80_03425 [Polytolypa hystricis UAMH7299]|uniref:HMG box domain-containing protein n=1 Tax=Polytolypa hystricis (strain UAMH7299) TaxID=1447883 RepID=A0A2B7YIV9_POLH7|nr:hypothetical protein AJ80_03425 [Polytolypa hystricis UAMH7299]
MTYLLARRNRVVFRCFNLLKAGNAGRQTAGIAQDAKRTAIGCTQILSASAESGLITRSLPIILRNSYATAAGRPKAHTGRATPAKKSANESNAKKATGSKTKAKEPAAKKPAPKRKVLTEKQKEDLAKKKARDEVKELKEKALKAPTRLPASAWQIIGKEHGHIAAGLDSYKNLSTMERQNLDNQAESNRSANRSAFESWVKAFTPLEIKHANQARRKLRRLVGKPRAYADIPDDRQVKRPRTSFMFYMKEAMGRAELSDVKLTERVTQLSQRWKSLSPSEQEEYVHKAENDTKRYITEYENVYGEAPPVKKSKPTS